MVLIEAKAKKWGSSLGVIIPKDVVVKEKIKEEESIMIEIKKKVFVRDLFGRCPFLKRSADELKREAKKGWD